MRIHELTQDDRIEPFNPNSELDSNFYKPTNPPQNPNWLSKKSQWPTQPTNEWNQLVDRLVAMGYDEQYVRRLIAGRRAQDPDVEFDTVALWIVQLLTGSEKTANTTHWRT